MKRFLLLLSCLMLLILPAAAEDAGFAGVWIENDGYGTLTLLADGSATMEYYDGTVTTTTWGLTDDGYRFGDGMWYNSPMKLLDANTLSVSNGWMVFTREGFLPTTDPAVLLDAVPVGEEGAPFLGEWNLTSLRIEGEEYDPAFIGMTMTILFNEDGTVVSDDGMEPYTTTWSVSYGYAIIEGDIFGIDENDRLVMEVEGDAMFFTRVVEEPVIDPVEEDPLLTPEDEAPAIAPAEEEDPSVVPTDDEALTFTPVGAEGDAFLGLWSLESIVMDGEAFDPALFGMTMTLDFRADGSVVSDDGLDPSVAPWRVENGVAIVDDLTLTINADGKLMMEEDGASMIFVRGEAAPSGDELTEEEQWMFLLGLMADIDDEPTELPESMQPFVGEWVMVYCHTGGLTGDLRTMGVSGYLTLDADGTGYLIGISDEFGEWYEDDGVIRFGENGMPMQLLGDPALGEEVFLQYGSEMGGYMIFSQNEDAVWEPAPAATPAPQVAPVTGAPAASASSRTGVRYVCSQFTSSGYTMDAANLGAEYALLFHESGTADLTIAGAAVPGLPYTITGDGVYSINYFGSFFNCTPTDAGFDMDFYGTMTLHFIPAE